MYRLPPSTHPPAQNAPRNTTISQDHTKTTDYVFSSATEAIKLPSPRVPLPPPQAMKSEVGKIFPPWDQFIESSPDYSSVDEEADPIPNQHIPSTTTLAEALRQRLKNLPALDLVSSQVTEHLMSTISQLQVENEMLKAELIVAKGIDSKSSSTTGIGTYHRSKETNHPNQPLFANVHLVQYVSRGLRNALDCSYYLDAPHMFKGDTKKSRPRGTIELEEVEAYLRNHANLAFVVLDVYQTDKRLVDDIFDKVGSINGLLNTDAMPLKRNRREICLGPGAKNALNSIIRAHPERFSGFQNLVQDHQLQHFEPYLFFYIHNKTVMELQGVSGLDELATQPLKVLLAWMEDNFRENWDEADALFAQGKVNPEHYSKLFRPGELIVSQNRTEHQGSFTASTVCGYAGERALAYSSYAFDGRFYITFNDIPGFHANIPWNVSIRIQKVADNSRVELAGELVDISSLKIYPIRFAEEGLEMKLVARGHKFWRLRKRCLVCYNEVEEENYYQAERRYMIDYAMYERLHPARNEATTGGVPYDERKEPSDAFLACLPPVIRGFGFSKKSWETLMVDRITDVTWNKTAFDQLVAPEETKELIQAMVTIHGEQSSATQDIIDGKGQGLLILLHGGPGTGKTLTAESIAEVQERPLYRVTCGDIGIEPREVEQYLGDVLEIGKAWGCVVLLDEADVFLEERSFTDQKRNAVISIFLRVLEYYDGILILTTNRVGSFDEAFKSRIQLALAYPRLNEEDRLKIWQNFMKMLPRSGQRVDMEDLQMNLHKLALVEINGRQIRNAVTMARHLAKFRHEGLRYKHMQDALRSVQRFNEYLSDVKGFRDDDWARADKLR